MHCKLYTFINFKLNILIHYRYFQTTQINFTIKTIFMFQVPYLHIEFHKGQICRWLLYSYLWKGMLLSLQWYDIHTQKDIKKGIAKHQIHIQTWFLLSIKMHIDTKNKLCWIKMQLKYAD